MQKTPFENKPVFRPPLGPLFGPPGRKNLFSAKPRFRRRLCANFLPPPSLAMDRPSTQMRWGQSDDLPPSLAGQNPNAFGQERPESSDDLSPVSTRHKKIAESNFTPFLSKLLRKQKTVPYNKIPACPIFTLPCLQVLSGESQCGPATLSLPDFASHPLAVTPAPPPTCPPAHPSLHPAF